MKLYKKVFLGRLLVLILIGMLIAPSPLSIYADWPDLDGTSSISVEEMHNRLEELVEFSLTDGLPFSVYTDDGQVFQLPRLSFTVITNEMNRMVTDLKFFIGVGYDSSKLCINDRETIRTIINSEVSNDIVDFVLSYTGIPRLNASFNYIVGMRIPPLPPDFIFTEPGPIWGEDRTHLNNWVDSNIDDEDGYESIESDFTAPFSMGTLMRTGVAGITTIGHPTDSNGSAFRTSLHANLSQMTETQRVARVNDIEVGRVTVSIFNATVDIATVELLGGRTVSTMLPAPWNWGGGVHISNFRGSPRLFDSVASINGMSGLLFGEILRTNGNCTEIGATDMIFVYPRGNITNGDSGSALVRRSDGAVLGTLAAWTTTLNIYTLRWVEVGVYTNVQRY